MTTMDNELEQLMRGFDNGGFRVDALLKDGEHERTERVYWTKSGTDQGPFIRKIIKLDSGLGGAYEDVFAAQNSGAVFRHLPHIFDCRRDGDSLVVIMEYLSGRTLEDEVRNAENRRDLVCRLFPQICDAATELHESLDKPVIHRDIKPSNIMVTWDNVYLIDLGIARSFSEEATADTRQFGTRSYAPPEQFGYKQTDVRSDVYALGMLLYFMLTGETPDPTLAATGFTDCNVPSSLKKVLSKATEFDPANRYRSAAELRDAFVKAAKIKPAESASSAIAHTPETKPSAKTNPVIRRRGLLSHIPRSVGLAWDIILLAYCALVFAVCVANTFSPGNTASAFLSFDERLISNLAVSLFLIVPVFLVCDRRPLHKWFPKLKRVSIPKQSLITLAIVAGIALFLMIYLQVVGYQPL